MPEPRPRFALVSLDCQLTTLIGMEVHALPCYARWYTLQNVLVHVQSKTEVLYAPQIQHDQGLNSWPPDHDSTFHVSRNACSNHSAICDFLMHIFAMTILCNAPWVVSNFAFYWIESRLGFGVHTSIPLNGTWKPLHSFLSKKLL